MESLSSQAATVPEAITDKQIDDLVDIIRAALVRARPRFSAANVQKPLEQGRMGHRAALAVEEAVEAVIAKDSNVIIRVVEAVVRSRTPRELMDSLSTFIPRTDYDAVACMRSDRTDVDRDVVVEFFRLGRWITTPNLADEYEKRGLTFDPYAVAAVNHDDSSFHMRYPNSTCYIGDDGNWYWMSFSHDEVVVACGKRGWNPGMWFGGVRKKTV